MAYSSLFSPNFTHFSSARPISHHLYYHPYLSSTSLQYNNIRKELSLPYVASVPYQPINVDYLEGEFSGHGVTFEGIGDNCVAKMGLDNGSTATLMLPSGLITSYKAPMWHGSTVELLHTSVSEGDKGEAVIQGGVSLALNYEDDNEVPCSPSTWVLRDIRGNSTDSIKVELISSDTDNMVETRYIVTLGEDILTSEISVTNSNSSPLQWTGSIISHLTVSSPEATYALGLEGSNFHNVPPFLSNFGIIPSDLDDENDSEIGQLWKQMGLKGFFSGLGQRNKKNASEEEMEGEEDDGYKQLNEQMSRIYTCAPRFFTLIDRVIFMENSNVAPIFTVIKSIEADTHFALLLFCMEQGRRNSVVVGRDGFDEVYMYSPGSSHEIYGEYSFICVGQSTMLKPIMLGPGEVWRGSQHLHNPNM
ncbi:protein NDH-DEPENDENT CYCLIC ELECTRON FLOW 5 [Gossypium australe]|uniref:Protein NDH-DEPENDENT CYCLIC ELECTRON FLOW 5 n=1 Tax=Gossypium australe TaxID=47621 RepID=A0A5B6VUS6_9ROSI|nr:protein NDH-DEPENDENT CYCLIC ELECTRON FLOW 5 [Gossypium australe]